MSDGYGKIYTTLFRRSLYGKGPVVISVMSYVISNQVPESKDPDSAMLVELNPHILRDTIGECTLEQVEKAIEFLSSPDAETNRPDDEGRRIVKLAQGRYLYRVVNGRYYREKASEDRRKEINRRAAAKYRAKQAARRLGLPLAGEKEYVSAAMAGATQEELGEIVTHWLPRKEEK